MVSKSALCRYGRRHFSARRVSFDSRWVLFSNNLGSSKLKKVDIQGGPPQNIADFPGNLGGADSNSNGLIICGSAGPILSVPASGGQTTPVTALAAGETSHRCPNSCRTESISCICERPPMAPRPGLRRLYRCQAERTEQAASAGQRPPGVLRAFARRGKAHLIFFARSHLNGQPFDPTRLP